MILSMSSHAHLSFTLVRLSSVYFFNWVVHFLIVEFEEFFVYLDNSPLSYVCFANIFSKSVTRLLILFEVFGLRDFVFIFVLNLNLSHAFILGYCKTKLFQTSSLFS